MVIGVIKNHLKPNKGSGKACKWCAQGECWSHGQVAKGGGGGKGKGGGKSIICNTCGTPGHKSPDCFQGAKGKGGGKSFGIVCNTCGTPGHKSPDCFQGAKGGGKAFGGGGGIICNTCGKPGHKSPDCFQGAKGMGKMMGGFGGGGIVCNNCGTPGHKSPDCFQGQKGKGGGKGKGLRGFPDNKKVWIGGLPAGAASKDQNKELLEHMRTAGTCHYCEVGKSGNGGAAYKTEEDVANAIAILNGSMFKDAAIEVDVWTKKEKE